MFSTFRKISKFLISHNWLVKCAVALVLLTVSVNILQYSNAQHYVPLTESISANFNQSLLGSEYFTAENVHSSLLTPYSEQGLNVAAGLYYYQKTANNGLKFTDFYAHGTAIAYEYSNSSSALGQAGIYLSAYSILFSSISNEKVSVKSFYTNFGSANLNLSSEPNQEDLSGNFNYYLTNNSAPTDLMQVNGLGNKNFGEMSLNSGIYGPSILIQTNANATNPLPIKVVSQSGTSFVYVKSKYLFIGDANSITGTFTYGGQFRILASYLQNAILSSNFLPSPTFTITDGSDLRVQTSSNSIVNTNNQTEVTAPNQINLNVISVNETGYYYTMFTLSSADSQIISNGKSLFNASIYNIPASSVRNDDNIVAGTFLGAAVATTLDIFDVKKLRKE